MSIDFQKEKERIELKNSTYIGSIGIYMAFSEKIEDAAFKYYLYDGIKEEETVNFITAMFSSIVEEQMGEHNSLNIEKIYSEYVTRNIFLIFMFMMITISCSIGIPN